MFRGFEGYITSDCGAVEDVYDTHHYADTPVEAISGGYHYLNKSLLIITMVPMTETLSAGMDMECGKWFDRWLDKAVSSGKVNMKQVDGALTNLFTVLMRLGRFNKSGPFQDISLDEVKVTLHSEAHGLTEKIDVVYVVFYTDKLGCKSSSGCRSCSPGIIIDRFLLHNDENVLPFIIFSRLSC